MQSLPAPDQFYRHCIAYLPSLAQRVNSPLLGVGVILILAKDSLYGVRVVRTDVRLRTATGCPRKERQGRSGCLVQAKPSLGQCNEAVVFRGCHSRIRQELARHVGMKNRARIVVEMLSFGGKAL